MTKSDEPLRRVSLRDQLSQRLEQMVLAGEILPGDTLPSEREMMNRWGISRTVVRDAIRTLESRGLVQVRQGVGAVVTSDVQEAFASMLALLIERGEYRLSELMMLRMALEDGICELATQFATKEDLETMAQLLQANLQAIRDGDLTRAEELHWQFHLCLIESTHNRPLIDLIAPLFHHFLKKTSPLHQILSPSISLETELEDNARHRGIFECIKAGDAEGAARRLREELAIGLETLRRSESATNQETSSGSGSRSDSR